MKKMILAGMAALLMITGFTSCDKDPDVSNREVTYELTGNYSGQLFVVTSDNVNGNETFTATSLPWIIDKSYASNVTGIGFGGNSVVGHLGAAGQTVTVKIYAGGSVVRTGTATADVNGIISLPSLGYVF